MDDTYLIPKIFEDTFNVPLPERHLVAAMVERAYADLISEDFTLVKRAISWILDTPTLSIFSPKFTFEQAIDLLDIDDHIWDLIRSKARKIQFQIRNPV